MMNNIATLCILYENFRFEPRHLSESIKSAEAGKDQEAFYWIRRSLLTMHEFGKRLNDVCKCEEFENAKKSMPKQRQDAIITARRFINKSPLEDARNKFGGHLDPELVGSGLKFHGPNAISKISYVENADELALRLEFTGDLFRGAFASNFTSDTQDLAEKFNSFYEKLGKVDWHAAKATYELALEFLWDEFGQ